MTKHFSRTTGWLFSAVLFWLSACGSGSAPDEQILQAGAAAAVVTPLVEPFEDLNQNRQYDQDEPYTDLNNDGQWNEVFLGGFGANRGRSERAIGRTAMP